MKVRTGDDEYVTKPVDHIFEKYFKLVNTTEKQYWETKEIPLATTRWIFLFGLNDFYNKEITLDDISTIANDLITGKSIKYPRNGNDFDNIDRELGEVLEWTAELTFYNWKKEVSENNSNNLKYIQKMMKRYYLKHKYLMESSAK